MEILTAFLNERNQGEDGRCHHAWARSGSATSSADRTRFSDEARGWMAQSLETNQQRVAAGELDASGNPRTASDIRADSISKMAEGQNATVVADIQRAAQEMGYSGAEIADGFMRAGVLIPQPREERQSRTEDSADEHQMAMINFQQILTQSINNRMHRLRELDRQSQAAGSQETPQMRQERERLLTELAAVIGGTPQKVQNMIRSGEEEGQTTDQIISGIISDSILRAAARNHYLGSVPVRTA